MHDNFNYQETPFPRQASTRGAGLRILFGWHPTTFGQMMIACTKRGICFLGLKPTTHSTRYVEERLHAHFPLAEITRDNSATERTARAIENRWCGQRQAFITPLSLDIHGTPFQLQVWRALMDVPFGSLVCYADIARKIGKETAARAVGGAVGSNPVSLLIPCHRVIQSSGQIENYGWGTDLKHHLIQMENAV